MLEVRSGEKVYFDSFSGIVKGVYLSINRDKGLYGRITIRVTSKRNKTYKTGEIIEVSPNHVFIRQYCKIVYRSGIAKLRIIPAQYMYV